MGILTNLSPNLKILKFPQHTNPSLKSCRLVSPYKFVFGNLVSFYTQYATPPHKDQMKRLGFDTNFVYYFLAHKVPRPGHYFNLTIN